MTFQRNQQKVEPNSQIRVWKATHTVTPLSSFIIIPFIIDSKLAWIFQDKCLIDYLKNKRSLGLQACSLPCPDYCKQRGWPEGMSLSLAPDTRDILRHWKWEAESRKGPTQELLSQRSPPYFGHGEVWARSGQWTSCHLCPRSPSY